MQKVVEVADAAAHIMDVARGEAAKCKEAARTDNNEFNIRKNFLTNAINSIKEATCSQYNIVICTDQDHDDFQNLKGQILPMDLLNVEVSQGKIVNFEVYVFDTGNYLRHGKYEPDHGQFWGESKKWFDPAAMHVDFKNAQKKLDPAQIKASQAQSTATTATAASATAASQAVQASTAAAQAGAINIDGAGQAAAAVQAQGQPAAPAPGLTDRKFSDFEAFRGRFVRLTTMSRRSHVGRHGSNDADVYGWAWWGEGQVIEGGMNAVSLKAVPSSFVTFSLCCT